MAMSSAAEINEAFGTVDHFLLTAAAAAPAVALLLERARQQGVSEHQLAAHLCTTASVLRWLVRVKPDATANRIDLDGADVGQVVLDWARRSAT